MVFVLSWTWEYVDSVLTLTQPSPSIGLDLDSNELLSTTALLNRHRCPCCMFPFLNLWDVAEHKIHYWCLCLHWVFLKSNYAVQLGSKKNYAILTTNTQPSHDHRARQASRSTLQPFKTHSCPFNLYELPLQWALLLAEWKWHHKVGNKRSLWLACRKRGSLDATGYINNIIWHHYFNYSI